MKVIILAGGNGTRLWPLSRNGYPKQFIKLQEDKLSLFQETFIRSLMITDITNIYVVTNINYKFLVMGEIEELGYNFNEVNILVEPEGKNTLPAIYVGVHEIEKQGHDSVVVVPSDHMIVNSKDFAEIIKASEKLTKEFLITFGIKPDYPNTGFGYISPGDKKEHGFTVKEFKEKPDYKTAVEYMELGYYWNSGIFMFNSKLFIDEVVIHAPMIFEAFKFSSNAQEAFTKIENSISIDYGIMEKSSRVAVIPVDIGWNDLGSFDSFYDVFEKDESNNILNKHNVLIDSTNNIIHTESSKLVATVGVDDLIIIDNRDALLICKKDQSQKVKEVVETLNSRKDIRTEYHVQDYRPWGHYKLLEEETNLFRIKRISVNQGKKVSYQLHHHRSEHWIVVKGMAKVTIDDEIRFVRPGESIFIKAGQKHSLENPGKQCLEIIEVQMGDYLKDDDIVRFDDAAY
ncbi:mannose-1-phosphate guanylyltransferase/mannose-6-phosphate isomerase [Paenibacillus sp. 7124]|uniref:mannose-1-phosphate guanylyltransferase n=1 Tax=Paenibacillus apii TaxID=1850370 RepID=A0A6M1PTJ1_9BACL|nr:mannose-1-phosphate guanylyltransferase/mannose-6-phosphate isomerase [Paenibacillus apii]NGM83571.1 mannose-1-phosphate guanylyltransferase/mannose-6-phosphate isomerase [Paenibacillus apii]